MGNPATGPDIPIPAVRPVVVGQTLVMDAAQRRSARAALASHRLVGWTYWDPVAIDRYTQLGVPDGVGLSVCSRAAP